MRDAATQLRRRGCDLGALARRALRESLHDPRLPLVGFIGPLHSEHDERPRLVGYNRNVSEEAYSAHPEA